MCTEIFLGVSDEGVVLQSVPYDMHVDIDWTLPGGPDERRQWWIIMRPGQFPIPDDTEFPDHVFEPSLLTHDDVYTPSPPPAPHGTGHWLTNRALADGETWDPLNGMWCTWFWNNHDAVTNAGHYESMMLRFYPLTNEIYLRVWSTGFKPFACPGYPGPLFDGVCPETIPCKATSLNAEAIYYKEPDPEPPPFWALEHDLCLQENTIGTDGLNYLGVCGYQPWGEEKLGWPEPPATVTITPIPQEGSYLWD